MTKITLERARERAIESDYEIGELLIEIDEYRKVLIRAAAQFRVYEENHRAKGTPDSIAKAAVNDRMAALIEGTLKRHQ